VGEAGAGVVFEPATDALVAAIRHLRSRYPTYQAKAQRHLAERFSPNVHLDRYRELYERVGR
ncbi:MAG: hypothetical protein ABIY46_02920, partial [Gemmatimonadales bacterium]